MHSTCIIQYTAYICDVLCVIFAPRMCPYMEIIATCNTVLYSASVHMASLNVHFLSQGGTGFTAVASLAWKQLPRRPERERVYLMPAGVNCLLLPSLLPYYTGETLYTGLDLLVQLLLCEALSDQRDYG